MKVTLLLFSDKGLAKRKITLTRIKNGSSIINKGNKHSPEIQYVGYLQLEEL